MEALVAVAVGYILTAAAVAAFACGVGLGAVFLMMTILDWIWK